MKYQFGSYRFDSESLTLTDSGNSIEIRSNEAKLLALLLSDCQHVFSKEEILDKVWHDKVVSEQAVFQNISHLRNLFGNQAIKTFSKRGYQWQLPLLTEEVKPESTPSVVAAPTDRSRASANGRVNRYARVSFATFTVMMLACLVLLGSRYIGDTKPAPPIRISTIEFSNPEKLAAVTFSEDHAYRFEPYRQFSAKEFLTNYEKYYHYGKELRPWVLTGELSQFNGRVYLDFLLKGPHLHWQGTLTANDSQTASKQLQQHVQQPFLMEMLATPLSVEAIQARLSIAHQKNPDDLLVLAQLTESFYQLNKLDNAMILAEKLAESAHQQHNMQQQGYALLLQTKILKQRAQLGLSEQKLQQAIFFFKQVNDLKRLSDAYYQYSWIAHTKDNYQQIKHYLLKASQLALQAGDIRREIESLTYLSVMAFKHQQTADQYQYLRQAELKMEQYQLAAYHFAKVPFHHAIFTKNSHDKVPHLKQVLTVSELTPNHWVAQSSRLKLMKYYLENNRQTDAEQLTTSLSPGNAHYSMLKTLLAQSKNDHTNFIHWAKRTFEQAHFSGEYIDSLNIALLLLEYQLNWPAEHADASYKSLNTVFYRQYISNHANKHWIEDKADRLEKVGISML